MLVRPFGKTGWLTPPVGLGCWQFGGAITLDGKPDGWSGITDDESISTIQRALDLGIIFFDTADQYGWGHSETLLGRALKEHGERDRLHIASKVGFWHDGDERRTLNESRDYILRACEASLKRLETNYIDVYQCHLAHTERWQEFLEAFDTLTRQGKIRFFGISTNDFEMVQRFNERRTLAAVQANYSMLDRRAETDILPYCRERGIAFIARGVLARGLLTGKYDKNSQFDANDIRSKWLEDQNRAEYERNVDIVQRLEPIASRNALLLPQMAVKYILNHVDVSTVIVGVKNRRQIEDNVTATLLPSFTRQELVEIETVLSPPPSAAA
jgi:aryl-alcohol dehydrogenase-like predicted oxidoreductase